MRRESSTVVVLVGEASSSLLAGLSASGNVSVVRTADAGTGESAGADDGAREHGWEPGALAMREAARRRAMYVVVPEDPLADVAAGWRTMWDLSSGPGAAAAFQQRAADALTAWRDKQFELPDYYLVLAPAQGSAAGPDLYLGPLHAVRPHRVAVAGMAGSTDAGGQAACVLNALRSLEHGPWWPPLGEVLDTAGRFYAGGLAGPSALALAPAPSGPR